MVARSDSLSALAAAEKTRPGQIMLLATWFGITTGLVEGIGLLVFQQINAANWARMVHVSAPIVWIAVVVDVLFFWAAALGCIVVSKLAPRVSALKITVFLLSGLAIYDWLALTGRLYYAACLLMAIGGAVAFKRWFERHQQKTVRFWKSTTPVLVVIALLVFALIEGGGWWRERRAVASLPQAAPGSPNVIVVVFDALRADHVSVYGYHRPTTPELDKIASQGALFENAISASSWSLPSHASLVTGRYEFEHHADKPDSEAHWARGRVSFAGYSTLGEALEKRGYRTGAFSANRVFFTHNDGFGRGFIHFEDYFDSAKDAFLRTLYGREFLRLYLARGRQYVLHKRAAEVNRELLAWVDRDRERPFFAFLNYFDVHDPYGTPGTYPRPQWPLKNVVDDYDAGAQYDSDYLGRLLQALEQRGVARDTLLIVTSDHGEALGQHGLSTHGRALYRELVHVPLVIWYPGHVPAVRIDRPVSNAAIPATVLDLVGGNSEFPGPPLSQLWKRPETAANWPMPLSEMARNPYPELQEKIADQMEPTSTTGALKSLVTPKWHLISHENLGDQVYDWAHDPEEKRNLLNSEHSEISSVELQALLSALPSRFTPRLESTSASQLLRDGTYEFRVANHHSINQYHRIAASPGSKIAVQVRSQGSNRKTRFDPVLAIEDGTGQPLRICRNRGDDHLKPPGISDPTPDSFDDVCINDDDQPGRTDARLEILTPGGSPSDLYVHVLDWSEAPTAAQGYELKVTGISQNGAGSSGGD